MDEKNIIRNIVKEINKECKKDNLDIDVNFCTFYVNLLALDPNWRVFEDILRARSDVQKLIQYVVSKMKNSKDSQIQTLKAQFYFEFEFEHLTDMPSALRRELLMKLMPLRLSILEPPPEIVDQISTIYEKVVKYITLIYSLGNPVAKEVYREAETALKSFWSPEDVSGFYINLHTTRSDQLEQLGKITTGIRLYNMDCNRGGMGVYNLPDRLGSAIEGVKERIVESKEETLQRVRWLSEIVRKCYKLNSQKYILSLQITLPPYASKNDLEYIKDLLLIYKQYSEMLRKLDEQLDVTEKDIDKLKEAYSKTLELLHDIVVPNMHIRSSIVFPVFEKLSELWLEFQDQTVKLKGLANILHKIDNIVKYLKFESPLLSNWIEEYHIPTKISIRDFQHPIAEGVNIFSKDNLKYFSKVLFEFGGHCCWYLALTQGGLAMGDENHGIIKYKEYFFIFSNPLGLKSFARRPEYYILRILALARRKCELINYLGMKQRMMNCRLVKELCENDIEIIESSDESVSMDSHIISEYTDPTYEWNVWELKRKALKLANCINRATKSTQTDKSSNKTSGTQILVPKENFSQTHRGNYCITEKSLQYIYGLRGRKDDKQLQLNLTDYVTRPSAGNKNMKKLYLSHSAGVI